MSSPDLLSVCIAAFTGVVFLLGVLAAVMRLILFIFPFREKVVDAVIIAAVSAVTGKNYPNMKISSIEEIK